MSALLKGAKKETANKRNPATPSRIRINMDNVPETWISSLDLLLVGKRSAERCQKEVKVRASTIVAISAYGPANVMPSVYCSFVMQIAPVVFCPAKGTGVGSKLRTAGIQISSKEVKDCKQQRS